MDLEHVELVHVRLPLVRPFASARGTIASKDALLVHIRDQDGAEGWGECAAEIAPTYAGEFLDAAWLSLVDHLVPRVRAGQTMASIRGNHMAKAALEMADLDRLGRRSGRSLAHLLGGRPGIALAVGVVVEMDNDVAVVAERAATYVAAGYRRVKVKIQPSRDRDVIDAVRSAVGPKVALWADANGSYRPADAMLLADLDLDLLEQPFAAGDLVDHAAFIVRSPQVHVSLDESIASIHDARAALALHAARSLALKPGRVGGLGAAVEIHAACRAAHLPVWCGGMLETGIGRAANLALASLPGFTLPGDISASARYFEHDLTSPFVLASDGTLNVPDGAGLGVDVDVERLRSHAMRSTVV